VPCDPGGDEPDWQNDPRLDTLPGNNRLVIYELPTRWSRIESEGTVSIAGGTFRDVLALVERTAAPVNFAGVAALAPGAAHSRRPRRQRARIVASRRQLRRPRVGIRNEQLFAADFDLGFPRGHTSPTASADLAALVTACHRHSLRFFADVVMAFATRICLSVHQFSRFPRSPWNG
jgi:hypothetical protein